MVISHARISLPPVIRTDQRQRIARPAMGAHTSAIVLTQTGF